MKKNIAILILLVMSATFGFAQQAPEYKATKMEKKVLNKIRRTMHSTDFKNYVDAGQKESFIVTCFVNDENIVVVKKVNGMNEELADEITSALLKYPVECCSDRKGETFRFKLTFENRASS